MFSVNRFHEIMMNLKGFKKVMLNDSKGVLTEANNHKWVKDFSVENIDVGMHILPSGTVVQTAFDRTSPRVQKNIIKPDKSGIRIFKGMGGVDGSYDISRVKKFNKYGSYIPYKPVYEPAEYGERLSFKSPLAAKEELAEKEKQWKKARLDKKRNKFIADFNKKYERKDIKGADGSRSKYVIDRETGNIVQFFRKNKNGETMNGTISYEGSLKIVDIETPKGMVHKEIIAMPTGKYVTKTTVTSNGKIKNERYAVSAKGSFCPLDLDMDREKYLEFLLADLK